MKKKKARWQAGEDEPKPTVTRSRVAVKSHHYPDGDPRCKGTRANGEPCFAFANASGLCPSHSRQAAKVAESTKSPEVRTPGDAVGPSPLPPPAGFASWLDVIVARHEVDHSEQEAHAAAEELARLRRVARKLEAL